MKKIYQNSRLYHEMKMIYKSYINSRGRKGNIAMFHTGRCGSRVLGDTLTQNPNIHWGREIFNHFQDKYEYLPAGMITPIKILKMCMYGVSCSYYGFETKSLPEQDLNPKVINMKLQDYIRMLLENQCKYFIVLERQNYLRRAVSAAIGYKTRKWHSTSETKKINTVHIDINSFKSNEVYKPLLVLFDDLERHYKELYSILQKYNLLKLTYEDDIMKNPTLAYTKICKFIGIEPSSVKVRYKKSNPFGLDKVIENYDEIEKLLRGTKYYWMLSE